MAPSRTTLLVAAAVLMVAGAARAGEARPASVAFNVGAATDYEFRGINQTDRNGDLFAGADATIEDIGYAGVWLSNVDFHNGTTMEYDLYGGIRPVVGLVTVDLGFIRYGYTGQPPGPREVYTEWKVAPSMALGPAIFGLAWFHSDNFIRQAGAANYYEINASTPIGRTPFSVSGALGRQQVRGPLDYTTWNLGVSYALNSRLGFDLRYWDTDSHNLRSSYGSRVVLGVKATFP